MSLKCFYNTARISPPRTGVTVVSNFVYETCSQIFIDSEHYNNSGYIWPTIVSPQ